MPKAKARRRSSPARKSGQPLAQVANRSTMGVASARVGDGQERRLRTPRAPEATNIQSLLMPAMVALGCWGMSFTFAVFSTDPNRLLFAGIAALMALMWSVSLGVRIRKMKYHR